MYVCIYMYIYIYIYIYQMFPFTSISVDGSGRDWPKRSVVAYTQSLPGANQRTVFFVHSLGPQHTSRKIQGSQTGGTATG